MPISYREESMKNPKMSIPKLTNKYVDFLIRNHKEI